MASDRLFTGLKTVSIAVESIDEALPRYVDGLGLDVLSSPRESPRGYSLRWIELGIDDSVMIELLEPTDGGPVAEFLSKRPVSAVYQVRLGVRSLPEVHEELRRRGVRTVEGPSVSGEPGVGWIHPRSTQGVLFELVETD